MPLREGECEFCGRKELIIPTDIDVILCPKHFEKVHAKELLKAQGRVRPLVNLDGSIRCNVCGEAHPIMYVVNIRRACPYCMWQIFGKQGKRPMKIDGARYL